MKERILIGNEYAFDKWEFVIWRLRELYNQRWKFWNVAEMLILIIEARYWRSKWSKK